MIPFTSYIAAQTPNAFQWVGQSPKHCPFFWGESRTHLIHGSLGQQKSFPQTASQSVQFYVCTIHQCVAVSSMQMTCVCRIWSYLCDAASALTAAFQANLEWPVPLGTWFYSSMCSARDSIWPGGTYFLWAKLASDGLVHWCECMPLILPTSVH